MSFSAGVHNRPATDGTPGHPGRCHGLNGRNAWTAHPCRQFTGGNLSSKRLLAQSSAPGQSPPIHGPTGFAAIAVEPWEMPWEIQPPKPSRTSDSKKEPGHPLWQPGFLGASCSLTLNPPTLPGIPWRSLAPAGTNSGSCSSRPPLHPSPYPQSRRSPRGIRQQLSGYSPALPGRYFTWPVRFCRRAREQTGELPEQR